MTATTQRCYLQKNTNKPSRLNRDGIFMLWRKAKMEEKIYCSHCGAVIEDDDYTTVNGQIVCSECIERYCCVCDRCGATVWDSDAYGDEYTNLCQHCYDNYYTRCQSCEALMHIDDAYHYGDSDYCSEC